MLDVTNVEVSSLDVAVIAAGTVVDVTSDTVSETGTVAMDCEGWMNALLSG